LKHRSKQYGRRALLVSACLAGALIPAQAADEACKRQMSDHIKVCAEACRDRALAATDVKDPNNNILFGCIKICAQNMALQMQVCP
jgi:hypothetical protein